MFGDDALKRKLADVLCASAGDLLDFRIRLMDEEISQGWRCFHARCFWFSEHLPAPLINELGRKYSIGELQSRLAAFAEGTRPRMSPTREAMMDNPAMRASYRNFLDVGSLEVESRYGDPHPRDLTADEVTRKLLHEQGRNFWFEIARDEESDWREALLRSTETPPTMCLQAELVAPVRNPQWALHEDVGYWLAVYAVPQKRLDDFGGTLSPELTHQLMAHLAPDFPHDPAASTKRLIVFSRPAGPSLRWCVNVGYHGTSKLLAYPPTLSLASGSKRPRSVFNDVLQEGIGLISDNSARGVETQLRYWIPRFRKLIDFYSEKFSL